MKSLTLVPLGEKFGSPFGRTDSGNLGNLVTLILSATIAVAGVMSLFLFLQGGIQMIQAAGSSDPKHHSQGQQTLQYAIIGFIIVLGAYWVVQLIERIVGAPLTYF